jgi:hypothetical protein
VTGTLAFEGPADLAAGAWSGVFTGQLSGSYREANGNRIPWTVALMNPGDAALTTVEVLGCTAGTVTGRFHTKTTDYGQVYGLWFFSIENVIPRYIVAVDATFDFVWHRAGPVGALAVTDAVVDLQLYTLDWQTHGFASTEGWVRVVDTGHLRAGAATARLESDDPTSCQGVFKGELTEPALKAA